VQELIKQLLASENFTDEQKKSLIKSLEAGDAQAAELASKLEKILKEPELLSARTQASSLISQMKVNADKQAQSLLVENFIKAVSKESDMTLANKLLLLEEVLAVDPKNKDVLKENLLVLLDPGADKAEQVKALSGILQILDKAALVTLQDLQAIKFGSLPKCLQRISENGASKMSQPIQKGLSLLNSAIVKVKCSVYLKIKDEYHND